MYILFVIFLFLLGIIVGSFLNVVILRYNTGCSLGGRSGCMSCGHQLSWYELIPVVSFLFLRARCKSCKSGLSWQYPAVELLTGILFAATFIKIIPTEAFFTMFMAATLLFYLFIMCLLVVIVVYDIRHMIIPDGMVYAFIIASLLKLVVIHQSALLHMPYLLDLVAGPLLFLPFFLLWLVSGGRWMGFGDAKLAVGIGFMLGLVGGLSAIVLGFWIGAVVSVLYLALAHMGKKGFAIGGKRLTIKSEIPFAPYLILGTLLVFFFRFDVLGLGEFLRLIM